MKKVIGCQLLFIQIISANGFLSQQSKFWLKKKAAILPVPDQSMTQTPKRDSANARVQRKIK
jgi:hypothetical protein